MIRGNIEAKEGKDVAVPFQDRRLNANYGVGDKVRWGILKSEKNIAV